MNYGCEGKVAFISGGTVGHRQGLWPSAAEDGAEVWLLGRVPKRYRSGGHAERLWQSALCAGRR